MTLCASETPSRLLAPSRAYASCVNYNFATKRGKAELSVNNRYPREHWRAGEICRITNVCLAPRVCVQYAKFYLVNEFQRAIRWIQREYARRPRHLSPLNWQFDRSMAGNTEKHTHTKQIAGVELRLLRSLSRGHARGSKSKRVRYCGTLHVIPLPRARCSNCIQTAKRREDECETRRR